MEYFVDGEYGFLTVPVKVMALVDVYGSLRNQLNRSISLAECQSRLEI